MLLFDMHTHCFPDALAPKALPRLAEISDCPYHGDGPYGDLCAKAAAAGCTGFMILHIATKAKQMNSVNNFADSAISAKNDQRVSIGVTDLRSKLGTVSRTSGEINLIIDMSFF